MLRKILIAAALFALSVTAANAASRVWISEFGTLTLTVNGAVGQIAPMPTLTDQTPLDISTGVKTSAAFTTNTKYIRVTCEVQCSVNGAGTATTSSLPLGAMSSEYFGVQPGATISVIANP